MSLQHLTFDSINEQELIRLVKDGVGESTLLEYKVAFTATTDDQKREFLSDVTALANTDGGDLVYGIEETDGVATSLIGIKNLTPDEVTGRMENMLRDSVQPRISGILIRCLQLKNTSHVILLRVPRSFAAPHMVRHQGVTRFCGRNSNGKYDLDVHQLRTAFSGSESISEKLKLFRIERVSRLLSGNTPVPLSGSHLLVLHILPLVGTRLDTRISSQDLQREMNSNLLHPMHSSGWSPRFTLDGGLVASSSSVGKYSSYVQVLRNGFVEAVESTSLEPYVMMQGMPPQSTIAGGLKGWERLILDVFPHYVQSLANMGINPPHAVSISLLNVRGYQMSTGMNDYNSASRAVDRDNLLTDELLVESTGGDSARTLRPLFDQIWNGCGWHGSIHYDKDGNRKTTENNR